MFRRFADQLGATRALRLWQGRLLTSNLSIDGAMADFGAFCATPTWQRAVRSTYVAFGDEERYFGWAIASLGHFFQKYGPKPYHLPPRGAFLAELSDLSRTSFVRTNLSALIPEEVDAPDSGRSRLRDLLLEYFDFQQSMRVDYDTASGAPWIGSLADRPTWDGAGDGSSHDRLAKSLLAELAKCGGDMDDNENRRRIRRWFQPRAQIEYYRLTCDVSALIDALSETQADVDLVRRFISGRINASRRYFPELPQRLSIRAYRAEEHCQTWLATDPELGQQVTFIEAVGVDDGLAIFDELTPYARAERFVVGAKAGRVLLEIPPSQAGEAFLNELNWSDSLQGLSGLGQAPAYARH